MLMQGMLANTGIPSDAGRLAMIKAAAALARDAIEFTARKTLAPLTRESPIE